jgi:purine-nucleoside phosphorylase
MQGRFHRYEGYTTEQICFPVELMHALGVKTLLVSNAAGSLNPAFRKGELMVIDRGFSLQDHPFLDDGDNGLLFDRSLSESFHHIASAQGISIHKGSYVAVTGPMLETRAEYRYLINHGMDAVGMSTVPEATAATQLGMHCLAVSVLTDECDPDNLHPVTLDEIIAVAGKADATLSSLFNQFILEA